MLFLRYFFCVKDLCNFFIFGVQLAPMFSKFRNVLDLPGHEDWVRCLQFFEGMETQYVALVH